MILRQGRQRLTRPAVAAFMPSSSARRSKAKVAPSAGRRPLCQACRRGDAGDGGIVGGAAMQATVAPSAARRPSCQARRGGDARRRWCRRRRRRGGLHAKLVGAAMLGDGGAVGGAAASIGNDKTKRLFDAFNFLYSRRVSSSATYVRIYAGRRGGAFNTPGTI